jgi:hypothetical protein
MYTHSNTHSDVTVYNRTWVNIDFLLKMTHKNNTLNLGIPYAEQTVSKYNTDFQNKV